MPLVDPPDWVQGSEILNRLVVYYWHRAWVLMWAYIGDIVYIDETYP